MKLIIVSLMMLLQINCSEAVIYTIHDYDCCISKIPTEFPTNTKTSKLIVRYIYLHNGNTNCYKEQLAELSTSLRILYRQSHPYPSTDYICVEPSHLRDLWMGKTQLKDEYKTEINNYLHQLTLR